MSYISVYNAIKQSITSIYKLFCKHKNRVCKQHFFVFCGEWTLFDLSKTPVIAHRMLSLAKKIITLH